MSVLMRYSQIRIDIAKDPAAESVFVSWRTQM